MPISLDPQPTEDEFECARCGAHVHIDMTRCPSCGVNLYEPESDRSDDVDHRQTTASHSLRRGVFARLGDIMRSLLNISTPVDEFFGASLNQAALYNDLLLKVAGDRRAAERLVEYERRQQPNANRMVWLQNAILRWERDNQLPVHPP